MHPAVRRAAAVAKVQAKFQNRAFAWGVVDCVVMARTILRAMGHKPPSLPRYRGAVGARRALKAAGHANLPDLLDTLLPRITPAAMQVGDLVALPGEDGFDGLAVCAGRKLLGFHEEHEGLVVMEPLQLTAAWSVG